MQFAQLISDFREQAPSDLLAARLFCSIVSAAVCVLSFLEHGRNVAPSAVLTTYLVLECFSDVIQAGLLYVGEGFCYPVSSLTSAISATRFILLSLEGQTKTSILREPYNKLSPEETAGFFGVVFFWWVNKVLITGYSHILSLDDMPPLGTALDAMETRTAMQREWDRRSWFTLACASYIRFANQSQKNQKADFL